MTFQSLKIQTETDSLARRTAGSYPKAGSDLRGRETLVRTLKRERVRRVFTHLNPGWQANPFIHGARRLEDPDGPTFVVRKQEDKQKEQKVSGPNTPQESNDLEFYIIY